MSDLAAPSASRRWLALALIATAQFVVIMDTSIIGVALPRIQEDLGFSQENLSGSPDMNVGQGLCATGHGQPR